MTVTVSVDGSNVLSPDKSCSGSHTTAVGCAPVAVALIITLFVKLVLLPASISQQKNSAKQVRLNTKVNKIRQKYAGNQQKIQEETQALYQREGFGAANMGCLPMVAQLLVMMGVYGVIYAPITHVLQFSKEKVEILNFSPSNSS